MKTTLLPFIASLVWMMPLLSGAELASDQSSARGQVVAQKPNIVFVMIHPTHYQMLSTAMKSLDPSFTKGPASPKGSSHGGSNSSPKKRDRKSKKKSKESSQ